MTKERLFRFLYSVDKKRNTIEAKGTIKGEAWGRALNEIAYREGIETKIKAKYICGVWIKDETQIKLYELKNL